MQKGRDIGNLFIGHRFERRHAAVGPSCANHGANLVAVLIVQYERRPQQVGAALAARVQAMAKSAGGLEEFLAALGGCRVYRRRTVHTQYRRHGRLFLLLLLPADLIRLRER